MDIFRGKIVDVSPEHVMIEISGQEKKLDDFLDLMRQFGILEMVRTGRVALLRKGSLTADSALSRPEVPLPELVPTHN